MSAVDITDSQRLLLLACLGADAEFATQLRAWQASIELDDIDYGSMRLVPFLYRKIERLGIEARDYGRLRGIYARFWALHHTRAVPALDAVTDLPAQFLALKGTALQTLGYGNDPATRPSDDVDILVKPSDRERALRHLLRAGFELEVDLPLEISLNLRKGVSLYRNGIAVDLHWNILPWVRDPQLIDRMFQRAITIDYRGRQLRSLGATDTLLHTLTHGWGKNHVPPIRWVLDAAQLIRHQEIDWELFVLEAKASGWARVAAAQLELLSTDFGVTVPAEIERRLRSGGGHFDHLLQRAHLRTDSIWVKRLARLAGWDARVLASNLQRRASVSELLKLMWREYRWLKKHGLLAG